MANIIILTNSHVAKDARVYYKIARTLSERHNVTIACPGPTPDDEERIGWVEIGRGGKLSMLRRLEEAAVRHKPDVIIAVEPLTMLPAILARRKLHGRPRLAYDCHEWFAMAHAETYPRGLRRVVEFLFGWVEDRLLHRMDAAIAVNEDMASRLRRACDDVTVCANYPVEAVAPSVDVEKRYDIIYAGGISRSKGMLKLLQATALLRKQRPGLRVVFVGRFLHHDDHTAFDAFVEANDLADTVEWTGLVPFVEAQRYIASSRVGVAHIDTTAPRYRQTLPLKLIEYLQHGLLVVTSDTPIIRSVVQQHDVGVCAAYNSFALAAAAKRLLEMNEQQSAAMRERARNLVQDELNWAAEAPRLRDLIGRLTDDDERRLLMLSYFYPPLGGPGVQRPCKMVHYLRAQGWRTDVVSVGDIVTLGYEPGMLDECGHASLTRTPSLDPMWLLKRLGRKRDGDKVYFGAAEGWKRIVRGMFPIEDKIGWLPFALAAALRQARKHRYQAVAAVNGPYTAAIVGYWVGKITGLPLVLDYRDHWTLFPYSKYLTRWHRRYAAHWERKTLERASRVSIIGEVYRDELCATFGEHLRRKIHVVRNGWDERDFADVEPAPRRAPLHVRYVGNFNGHRKPDHFVQALRNLDARGELPEGLRFTFTGNHFLEAREQLTAPDLAHLVDIEPQVSHHEAVRRELGADLLLLFIASPNGRGVLTGKLFEYLRAGRPIFAMVPPDGEAASILREAGHTHICAMEDVASIERLLPQALAQAKEARTTAVDDTYSRAEQARRFAKMLKELP